MRHAGSFSYILAEAIPLIVEYNASEDFQDVEIESVIPMDGSENQVCYDSIKVQHDGEWYMMDDLLIHLVQQGEHR